MLVRPGPETHNTSQNRHDNLSICETSQTLEEGSLQRTAKSYGRDLLGAGWGVSGDAMMREVLLGEVRKASQE